MSRLLAVCVIGTAALLGACGEKVQTIGVGGERKADTKSWDPNNTAYLAPGWTPGTQANWDAQLRKRAQAQNDYAPR
jgi:hypothetical protein